MRKLLIELFYFLDSRYSCVKYTTNKKGILEKGANRNMDVCKYKKDLEVGKEIQDYISISPNVIILEVLI